MATDEEAVAQAQQLDFAGHYGLWRNRDEAAWRRSPLQHLSLARRLLRSGEPLLAFDILGEALTLWPEDSQLLVTQALALARSGATERARQLLQDRYMRGGRDEETVSLLARTYKDLALGAREPSQRQGHLQRAEALYTEAYEGSPQQRYWSGINAATLALMLGRGDEARRRARAVQGVCERQLAAAAGLDDSQRYWLCATVGESELICGHVEQAADWYRKAVAFSPQAYGDIASTRRNARLILEALGIAAELLDCCLPRPRVVVFSGHMIDVPERANARFPPQSEQQVAASIRAYLEANNAKMGFSSAACGADILFLEAMLERGGEVSIILPSAPESFVRASVAVVPTGNWVERFRRVTQRALRVTYASADTNTDVYFAYTNVLLLGSAKLQAKHLDGELSALSVWDGQDSGFGGTASALRLWRDCGHAVDVIDPANQSLSQLSANRGPVAPSDSWLSAQGAADAEESRKLVSLLFADAVGFSKLEEPQIPRFVEHFLGAIAKLLDRAATGPIVRNTWGDAVYFVFNDVQAAGLLALDVCELVASTHWPAFGLPEGMNVRIGLHSGPAYPITDPIIRQFSYTGVQVSRAARIEPITPPGVVYASHEFAALSEAVGVTGFLCEYVGQTSLAKHYGAFPTYRVRRL